MAAWFTFKSSVRVGKSSAFRPVRGGDGGVLPRDVVADGAAMDLLGQRRFSYRNAAKILSGAPKEVCLPTPNPFDQAHTERDSKTGFLKPAAVQRGSRVFPNVKSATPRMYHPSEFHEPAPGTRVHVEQVFDATHEAERRLAAMGLEVYGCSVRANVARAAVLAPLREITRGRTGVWST